MKKFFIILEKEIRELLNPRMLVPFFVVIVIFYFFGQYATKVSKESKDPQTVAVLDLDQSALSKSLTKNLAKANLKPKVILNNQDLPTFMRQENIIFGLVFPEDFENSVQEFVPKKIETYVHLSNFAVTGLSKYSSMDSAVAMMNAQISDQYLNEKVPDTNPASLKNPLQVNSHTIIKNYTAQVSYSAVLAYLGKQTYVIPIILFLVIIIASQMIATSIASEKEDKTLETMLTAPISRKTLVSAKMIGAGIVGLILSGVYMLGFRSYLGGISSTNPSASQSIDPSIVKELGLILSPQSYILLGVVIFLGILVALALAMILGAFAEDVKSVQTAIAPLMVLLLIPYFAITFIDIYSLPTIARYIFYAIPFSHTLLAISNLYLHNYAVVFYGALYELIVFIIFVWLAAWIFSTDKIMTLKFNWGKKRPR